MDGSVGKKVSVHCDTPLDDNGAIFLIHLCWFPPLLSLASTKQCCLTKRRMVDGRCL
ncbi:hypothetical protein K445DRAFT_322966 [Daldinia sp. EC12]|nr:hypothetical protein K445DRAFT_322966 [Daldinia sp. EC12]